MAKKPIKEKGMAPQSRDSVFGNELSVPEDIQKELDKLGLVARWINSGVLYEMNGYHAKGWVPFKWTSADGGSGFKFGNDPDGIVRRGDCILAVKTEDKVQQHRQYLAARSDISNVRKQTSAEFKREAGKNVRVLDGYDDKE